jgi:hypothetical protein
MRQIRYYLAAIFIVLALLAAAAVSAQENDISSPSEVKVGLYILNLGKFDLATSSFTVDFYLSMICDDNCTIGDFEFLNGRATSVDKMIDEPSEKFYRIQANLNSPIDLTRFPFDRQDMQIIIEDKEKTVDEQIYIPTKEESGIDESISFAGWNIDQWKVEEKIHEYKIYDETYSDYIFTVDISRIALNSFLKTFLPVLFMILIIMFTFIMDPDKITTRLTITTSSLVAAVMFHTSISNQIPPVGYLTIADKFMVLTYFIILAAVIINVIILELVEQKKEALVEKIHRLTEYSVLIIIPLLYALFFIIFVAL